MIRFGRFPTEHYGKQWCQAASSDVYSHFPHPFGERGSRVGMGGDRPVAAALMNGGNPIEARHFPNSTSVFLGGKADAGRGN